MEITMYEDNNYTTRENVAQMKRKFTLDLNGRSSKKFRTHGQVNFNPLLTSPDLNMLKLASPELDKLVLQQGCILPNGFNFPSMRAPSSVSSEDYVTIKNTPHSTVSSEEFVKGFQDTLEQFHHNAPESVASTVPTTISASSDIQYTQLEVQPTQQQVPVTSACGDDSFYIKEEPQIVPNVCSGTPPVSPINMEAQERIKLERKRLRNRIAASKCRRRKLERISKLEDKVSNLKNENSELQAVVNRMKDQVCSLKQEVMEHVNSGCEIPFLSATQCQ